MNLYAVLISGALAGLYSSAWGAIKDTPYEGFKLASFIRSPIVGVISVLIWLIFLNPLPGTFIKNPYIIYFFASMALERTIVECYKAFVRVDNQKGYRIPSYFAFYGQVFKHRISRLIWGFIFVSVGVFICFFLRDHLFFSQLGSLGDFIRNNLFAGFGGGFLISGFGANKDAPYEGFKFIKLWRSAFIAFIFSFFTASLTNDFILIGFAAGGMERTVIEFYKTFISRKKPGKFK